MVSWGVAVYVGAYLAQKAQHRATKEDLTNILNRAQGEAEAKKTGETDAVQKDSNASWISLPKRHRSPNGSKPTLLTAPGIGRCAST